jgi:hypothetical protein
MRRGQRVSIPSQASLNSQFLSITDAAETYQPLAGQLIIPAQSLSASAFGVPTLGLSTTGSSTKGVGAWLLDAAGNTGLNVEIFDLPLTWTTVNVDVIWHNHEATATGNVDWRLDRTSYSTGETIDGTETQTGTTSIAVAAQYVTTTTRIASAITVDPTKFLRLELVRLGASDTCNTIVACRALKITPA